MDIGTSTGGFTDCMLQHGAASVVAVDTGYGQIAEGLRRDPRVTLLERTNARYLKPGDLPGGISFVSMDVSFISATLVLPAVIAAVRETGTVLEAVVLIKPQFEAGREHVGRAALCTTRPRTSSPSIACARRCMILAPRPASSRIPPFLGEAVGEAGIGSFFCTLASEAIAYTYSVAQSNTRL